MTSILRLRSSGLRSLLFLSVLLLTLYNLLTIFSKSKVIYDSSTSDSSISKEVNVELKSSFNYMHNEKNVEVKRHSLDTITLPRLLSCQHPAPAISDFKKEHDEKMTITSCIKYCSDKKTTYAALGQGDSCFCLNQHGINYMERDSECNVTCSGDKQQSCGGKDRWMFYKIDDADGMRGWSIWMPFGGDEKTGSQLRTRYRGCMGDIDRKTKCVAELERAEQPSITPEAKKLSDYYIGCFTYQTWAKEPQFDFIIHSENLQDDESCIRTCNQTSVKFAVVTESKCICSTSLGWSRPFSGCSFKLGVHVYSTDKINPQQLVLSFEGRRVQKKIAVVSHYRGGSTFASLMFSSYPDAMYIFEPGSTLGIVWKGINMSLAEDQERNHIFLQRIYPLWFDCKLTQLPGRMLNMYPAFGERNSGFDEFSLCKRAIKSVYAGFMCSPLLEEKCLMAPIIAAKTTRMINAEEVHKFGLAAPDIEVIHAMRDPRGILQSRAKLEPWYRETQDQHLRIGCNELNKLREVFESPTRPPNFHYVRYEDLARDALNVTYHVYMKFGLTVPQQVIDDINRAIGKSGEVKRQHVYDVVQSNPIAHINSWITGIDRSTVVKAEQSDECKQFFKYYYPYYKPLDELTKEISETAEKNL